MQVQNEVGHDYGLYFELINLASILNIILDLGINNYNNRKIVSNPSRFSVYFRTASWLRLFLAMGYMAVLLILGWLLDYGSAGLKLLFLLGVCQVLLASILFVRSNFTALGKFKTDSLFSVLDRILMIGGIVYLLYLSSAQSINLMDFVTVQLIGYSVTLLLGILALFVSGKPAKVKYNPKFGRLLLRKSAPYALIVVLMSAYHFSDSIMIGRLLEDGVEQNAIYAQSFRILMALNNYAYLFAVLLLPMFAKQLSKKENIQKLLGTASSLLVFGVFSIAVLLFSNRVDFLNWCYNSVITEDVFAILLFGIVPMSFNYCFGALITASGNMQFLNKVAATALLFNIALNFVLIPIYGALGAAIASLITQSFNGLMQVFYAIKKFNLQLHWVFLSKFIGSILLLIVFLINDFGLSQFQHNILLLTTVMFGLLLNLNISALKQIIKGGKA